jgi:hypothetical protein
MAGLLLERLVVEDRRALIDAEANRSALVKVVVRKGRCRSVLRTCPAPRCQEGGKESRMPGWKRSGSRAALSVLTVPLAGSPCGDIDVASADRSAAVAAGEVCLVGRATSEGVECQAFRADGGRLYTLIGDLGKLADDNELCVCGELVEISSCMQGTTIAVTRIGPPDSCP